MTSYYKCSCGYTTKNKEYAEFHANHAKYHEVVESQSAFPGTGGLIAMVKNSKNTTFIKWYGTEESLLATYGPVEHKFSKDCDHELIELTNEAIHEGALFTYEANAPIIRNDSADRLFDIVE
ncbi:hypothetical protein ATCVCanal1_356R [Acanthocystis turfacea Chlorella virus Canal-1]|nr:hypothetical protein ATCVCanal1_356R [Acanthocystis turfacea Chlorella virus Canal-1]